MAITTPQVTQPTRPTVKRTIPYSSPGQPVQYVTQPQPNQPQQPQAPAPQVQAPQPVQAPQTAPVGSNQQVLQAGQEKAIQGFQSPTMDLLSQQTQGLLQNPQAGGMDWQKYQQAQMEQYDTNRAQAMDATRQQLAPVWNTGGAMGNFMDLALKGATERSTLQQNLAKEAAAGTQENLYRALSEGRQTAEAERQRFATDIGALVDVRGAAEGQENRQMTQSENAMDRGMQIALANQNAELQTGLTELKGKIDQGLLLTTQDFESVQNGLDRELEKAIAAGNWQNAIEITNLKGDIDAQAQEANRVWQTGERVATQSYMTTERISTEEFATSMKYLDQQNAIALQTNDIQGQKDIEGLRAQLALKMQTNDMEHDEKMAYLNAQLAEAKANNDVGRQKEILLFSHTQEMARLTKIQDFDEVMEYSRQEHEIAMQTNDFVHADAIQKADLLFRVNEGIKDRAIEKMRIDIEAKGLDMDAIAQQHAMIQSQIAAGTLDPEAGYKFLVDTLNKAGVDTSQYSMVDQQAAAQKALSAEYDNMRFQFMQTHPEFKEGNGLNKAGEVAFNEFFNKTMYGELTAEEKAAKLVEGYLPGSDLPIAQPGDKVNITTAVTAPNGATIPPGKYTIIEETTGTRSDFWASIFGEAANTKRYAVSEDGKTKIAIGTAQESKAGGGLANQFLDPFSLGGDVKF